MNKYLPSAILNLLGGVVLLSVTDNWGIWSIALKGFGVLMILSGFFMLIAISTKTWATKNQSDD